MPLTTRRKKLAIAIAAGLVLIVAVLFVIRSNIRVERVAVITGAVIAHNTDPHLQRPIRSATVIAESGALVWKVVSEASGFFRLRLDPPVEAGDIVVLKVAHPDYHPFAITTAAGDQIYVVRLTPTGGASEVHPTRPETRISNVRVRYATRITSTNTIGAAVRTFDIGNIANVPCAGRRPCSPDGKWKATVGSLSLDAGDQQQQFRNVRVSCIAGPCPFTAVESDQFSRGGHSIKVSVRNWSDPVTYLLEAEVVHTMESEMIRYTYPVIFGRSMNFTLPAIS